MVFNTMENTIQKFNGITDELRASFKDLLNKFNVTPVVAPVVAQNPVTQTPTEKFGEAKLKDGTVIKWEGEQPLTAGLALLVIDTANPEGFIPVPDGEHELEDGTIVITESGLVKEVKAVAPVVEEAPVTPEMIAQMSKELSEVKEQFSSVSKEKTDLEAKFNSEIKALKDSIEASNKIVKDMFEIFGKAIEAPSANPVEAPQGKLSKADKLLNKLK